jgi:hypothetical protein
MLRAAGFNESRRPEDLAKPIPAFVIQAAGGSIATPYLVAMATSDHLARCFGKPPNRDAGL